MRNFFLFLSLRANNFVSFYSHSNRLFFELDSTSFRSSLIRKPIGVRVSFGRNRVSLEKKVGSEETKFFLSILRNFKKFQKILGPQEHFAGRFFFFLSLRATNFVSFLLSLHSVFLRIRLDRFNCNSKISRKMTQMTQSIDTLYRTGVPKLFSGQPQKQLLSVQYGPQVNILIYFFFFFSQNFRVFFTELQSLVMWWYLVK